MSERRRLNRRSFVKLCASAVAAVSANPGALAGGAAGPMKAYNRVALVDTGDKPLKIENLAVGETYLFHYPYISTPAFLLNLGKAVDAETELETEAGEKYRWRGGVGPQRSLVAFSAICAHRMSHPSRQVNFINYRHEEVKFVNSELEWANRSQVIFCCSEHSVYDPSRGAAVLGGPAPQPLAGVELDYDARDGTLYAVGTNGGEMFERYFETFSYRLFLEHKTSDVKRRVEHTARVGLLDDYCRRKILC